MQRNGRPKTIQIFLPDGNARGVRIAEVTSRTVQAVQVPRSTLKAAASRDEVQRVGVYFLFGEPEGDTGKPLAYVGEAENCYQRIQHHHREREFWQTAVMVTSRTMSFTKAHARYLEYDCLQKAHEADRYRLKNTQSPAEPHIPEPMRAELRDNYGTIRTLLSVLGFPILDPLTTSGPRRILHCSGRGGDATGEYTEDGLVVFKGSTTSGDVAPSARDTVERRRQRLVEDGVLEPTGNGALQFTEDHAFSSPSGAAVIVQGMHINGWKAWADAEGRTLDELERQ
jgi:hypothetical protein